MKYNGIDFKDDFKVLDIKTPLISGIIENDQKIQGRDGVYITSGTELEPLYIDVEVEMLNHTGTDRETFFRNVAKKLYNKDEAKLVLDWEPNRFYMARLVGNTTLKRVSEYGVAKLTFKASDPFAYSLAEVTKPLNATFINEGTHESYGVITVTAPTASNLTVSNGIDSIELIYPFTGTQTIVIDLQKQYITMNGANAMKYLSLESDFFTVKSGSTQITSNGTGTIKYLERWL